MKSRLRGRLALSQRIVLLVLAVTGLAVVAASLLLIRRQESVARADLERRSVAIARSVAENIVGPLAFEDHEGAVSILRGLTSTGVVRSAAVYQRDGTRFETARARDTDPPPEHLASRDSVTHLAGDGLAITVPVGYGGNEDGMLRIVVSTESIAFVRRDLMLTTGVVLVALLAVAAALATWLRRLVTKPLLDLADSMLEVARDDGRQTRIELARYDEIERLRAVFDDLVARLDERERARASSVASLRALVAALPDAVLLLDAKLIVREVPIARRLGAIDATDLVGKTLGSVFDAAKVSEIEAAARGALVDDEVRTVYIELGSEREPVSYEIVASPLRGAASPVFGKELVLLVRDVSDRKAMELRAQQAEKMQAIGQLAGGIAHDFNNLLAVIMTNAELVEKVPPSKASVLLADLRGAAQRASDLVSQLLAFARKKNAVRVRIDVSEMIERVVRIVSRTVDPRIEIEASELLDECYVEADVAQLESALINLAVNSRDAMPNGGRITFSSRWIEDAGAKPSWLEIQVRDTGTGIPKDVLPHIFEPFFTTKPVGRGTGLGLSAVYGTVQAHGGTIKVETQLGGGTTFRIRLPRSEPPRRWSIVPTGATDAPSYVGRILFVEDDPLVRESTRFALTHSGFTVEAFARATDAIARFRDDKTAFDAALVDNVMPEMTGRDLIVQLRAIERSVPILLCSGGDLDVDATSEAARPDDFLPKPYSVDELGSRLVSLLESKRRREAHAAGIAVGR